MVRHKAHAQSLIASDGVLSDEFGRSVSQSGTIGLIGAWQDDESFTDQGSAYLFRQLGTGTGTLTENAKLTASDAAAVDVFGISVSQRGTIGLVGAFGKNSRSGVAYLFRGLDTASGIVTENAKLSASDNSTFDHFGRAVSLSGTSGLVGAYVKNNFTGAAYLFRDLNTATGTVTENVKLIASDAAVNDQFGISVSQQGTIGLVGASNKSSGKGAAYLFRNLNIGMGTVTEDVKLTASDGVQRDSFGVSVSQSGTSGLVGANYKNNDTGAAYLFRGLETATGTVTENVKLIASDAAVNDQFGFSVSLSGSIGLVGAFTKNVNRGAAFLFGGLDTATGTVTENVKLVASDAAVNDFFGHSLELSGDQFIIGAYGRDAGRGKAFIGTVSSVTTLDIGNTTRTIDGISFVSQDDWVIGNNSSGNQVTLNTGNAASVTASGKAVYVGRQAGSNNNTMVISGTLSANQIFIGSSGNTGNSLQLGDGGSTGNLSTNSVIINNGILSFNRSNTIIQGADFGSLPIIGSGGLTQAGSGTTILNAANTYAGTTTVAAGTLTVNGSHTGGGVYTVNGSLTGSGVIDSTVIVNGTLSPGNSVESFSIGAVTMNSGSIFEFEADAMHLEMADLLKVNGGLSLNNVTLTATGLNLVWSAGAKFTLISYSGTGITGGFAGFDDDTEYTFGGTRWMLNYNDINAGTNFNTEAIAGGATHFVTISAVPEPSSFMLFGALGLFLLQRRRA